MQVLQLPPTFDLSMKQKATASMTARLASERPRLLPGGVTRCPRTPRRRMTSMVTFMRKISLLGHGMVVGEVAIESMWVQVRPY